MRTSYQCRTGQLRLSALEEETRGWALSPRAALLVAVVLSSMAVVSLSSPDVTLCVHAAELSFEQEDASGTRMRVIMESVCP